MQYIPAWARTKSALLAAALIAIGIVVAIVSTRSGREAQPSSTLLAPNPAGGGGELGSLTEQVPEPTAPPLTPTAAPVVVYVSGAVRAPDVYELPAHARVKDLVIAAGGMTDDADPDQINLAERVSDGQHIHVPRRGEPAPPQGEAAASGANPGTAESGKLINLNSASEAELEDLPGVGLSLAQRITEYRAANGPFKSVEDLRNVKGIGQAKFAEIAPHVTIGP